MITTAKSNTSATATIAMLVPPPILRLGAVVSCDMVFKMFKIHYPSSPCAPSMRLLRSALMAKSWLGSLVMIWSSV